ncbi:hypothetical protein [Alcanivorax sp. DSM 26295]|jgi:hypothetical protein|uniref:hypothetical protein n=1 Tax=Alloalcanivorax venustensis TaxID=172371 RepID=UPI00115CAE38|nr:hypothetical protein [bacterium]SMO37456.1 hypothetical protein SAMN06272769_101278 [Alcanivorax sp. DSM 26295]|tara:strand:- start:503 stop:1123 length:621 start_codon:yes stop_codon:yes gene_type:complete
MGFHDFGALRVSPQFTTQDWEALDSTSELDWRKAAEIVKDRLDGRFLQYARSSLESPHSGFLVLAIDCLLMETIQQFRLGVLDGRGRSQELVTGFLEGDRFQPGFDGGARADFFNDIRCGLLHQAEAREMWLVRREQGEMLGRYPNGEGYVIDVQRFHDALELSFSDYLAELCEPTSGPLRDNLWEKMEQICNVRNQRGLVFAENG